MPKPPNLDNPLTLLQATTAALKLQRLVEDAAKAAGMEADAYMEKKLKRRLEILSKGFPSDQAAQLKSFRESVGEEMWKTIALNPSLPELLKTHMEERQEATLARMIEIIGSALPKDHGMTPDEMTLVIAVMTAAAS